MKLKLLTAILRHKWYVLIAGWRLKVPLWRLLVHDLSKWSLAEFTPYACQFYGDKGDIEGFSRAWLHHQNYNRHHWEYWISRSGHNQGSANGALPMPEVAVREMVADWMAAGRVYNGRWHDLHNFTWFWENRHKMTMHPRTWARLLMVLDEAAQSTWQ